MDLIYAQPGILYEIIPEALRSTHSVEKPKPRPHVDGVVGSVNSPTVDSLSKKIHEFSIKHSTAEVARDAPSPQNANVFAQSSQKGNQQPIWKKNKGNKCEENQNKHKPTNNVDEEKRIRIK